MKIDYDKYFVKQDCPVCASNDKKILHKDILHTCHVLQKSGVAINNEDAMSDVVICLNCGHNYLSIVLKDEIVNNYYSVVNSEYYDTQNSNPQDRRKADTKKFADLITQKAESAKNVLEIGSGMGYLLKQLQLNGFDCYGVEPSSFASEFSRKTFNLNVITAMLDQTIFPNKKFDVIVISDVVEHVANINGMFNLVQHYLAKNGRVIILTGDSDSQYAKFTGKKWLYYFSWEHISFFNKKSVKYLFDKHSLQLDYFKKTQHTGSVYENIRLVAYTFFCMVRNFFGIRKEAFYVMAFDHFIAIGKNNSND